VSLLARTEADDDRIGSLPSPRERSVYIIEVGLFERFAADEGNRALAVGEIEYHPFDR
jgi:hypothetical protein